jgi:hypothetical protein
VRILFTAGLAESLARPGRNATGLDLVSAELAQKWVELAVEAFPAVTRILGLSDNASKIYDKNMDAVAEKFRVTIIRARVQGVGDIDVA